MIFIIRVIFSVLSVALSLCLSLLWRRMRKIKFAFAYVLGIWWWKQFFDEVRRSNDERKMKTVVVVIFRPFSPLLSLVLSVPLPIASLILHSTSLFFSCLLSGERWVFTRYQQEVFFHNEEKKNALSFVERRSEREGSIKECFWIRKDRWDRCQ